MASTARTGYVFLSKYGNAAKEVEINNSIRIMSLEVYMNKLIIKVKDYKLTMEFLYFLSRRVLQPEKCNCYSNPKQLMKEAFENTLN